MKIGFLCPLAHLTIIEKPETVSGRIPEEVVCSHLGCGIPSSVSKYQMDDSVTATHVFYNTPKLGEILSLEEENYLKAGGLMFRTIPENVPPSVKKEFVATEGISKLAVYIIRNFPIDQRLPDIIDTAILHLSKYKGHLNLMKSMKITGKDLN